MNDAIEPAVWNFAGEEDAARAEDAMDFGEGAVLERGGFEVMQNENGDGAGERAIRERQGRGVALHYTCASPAVLREYHRGLVIVFEAGYSRRATQQLTSGGSGSGADFEDMVA
jgi:hypothetical protein